jgi:hypothetical protein
LASFRVTLPGELCCLLTTLVTKIDRHCSCLDIFSRKVLATPGTDSEAMLDKSVDEMSSVLEATLSPLIDHTYTSALLAQEVKVLFLN